MLDMIASLWDDVTDEIKEEQELKKIKPNSDGINEFGDKMGKKEICQGILLMTGIAAIFGCACVRGCQEFNKHKDKTAEKVQAVLSQNQR